MWATAGLAEVARQLEVLDTRTSRVLSCRIFAENQIGCSKAVAVYTEYVFQGRARLYAAVTTREVKRWQKKNSGRLVILWGRGYATLTSSVARRVKRRGAVLIIFLKSSVRSIYSSLQRYP